MFESLKSWKTTLMGSIALVFAVIFFCINRPIEGAFAASVGLGLLAAKDSSVTGTGNSARTENEINQLQQDKKHIIND